MLEEGGEKWIVIVGKVSGSSVESKMNVKEVVEDVRKSIFFF